MKDTCHLVAGWAGLCILAVDGWMWSGVRLAGLASRLVLQKVPSEANPKVRNHGEGPY